MRVVIALHLPEEDHAGLALRPSDSVGEAPDGVERGGSRKQNAGSPRSSAATLPPIPWHEARERIFAR
jgi:hypothetical protein